jgi:iron complex transport system substrate-binding protein
MTRPAAPAQLALLLAVVLVVTGACGLTGASGGPGNGDDVGDRRDAVATSGTAAPDLADVSPMSDVRAWDGEATAVADTPVEPVAAHPRPVLPATVTDAQGTKVTVEDASRVLALDVYGTLARTVFELGLGDRLVGRDISTEFAEAKRLPLVTRSGHDLDAEAILELDPTLIITDTSLGPWNVVLQVRDAGVPVVVVDSHRGLDNVGELIHQVAAALGVRGTGDRLAQRTERQVEEVTAQIAEVAPAEPEQRLRTVFLYVRGQSGVYYMFGEGSGADSLIEAIGGYDVAAEIGWQGMKPLTDEGLVAAQPDLVLMMTGGLESAGGVDGLLDRLPALADTPAGRHRRFVTMDDSQILGFGPITASVLNALAVATYAPGSVS